MKRRVGSVVLVLCLLLGLAPAALAEGAAASGETGGVSWSLSGDGTLTIGGRGAIPDYSKNGEAPPDIDDRPWQQYRYTVRRLVVLSGVTRVGSRAFQGFERLERVELADSVKSVGAWAFQNCFALSDVTMAEGVALETGAFRDTPAEASVVPPIAGGSVSAGGVSWSLSEGGTLTVGGSGAIPDYNKNGEAPPDIDDRPWQQYRYTVRRLVVLSGVTRVGSRAFQGFERLERVELADSVKSVGAWAFQNCFALSDVTVAEGVALETGAFRDTLLSVRVTVNGEAVRWTDAEPFIDANDRVLVPLRAMGGALGLSVAWDGEAREASFTADGRTIIFPIGGSAARTDGGEAIQMDTAAVIVNERAYAPARFLAEYFGFQVSWDGASRTVIIER